jgi:hypothetical protein
MPTMTYLKFDQDPSCNAPYPVNDIKYQLTFYKITGFKLYLDEIEFAKDGAHEDPGRIRNLTLGLPLGLILSQFAPMNHRYQCKTFSKGSSLTVKAGVEDIFIPFDSQLDRDYEPVKVVVHGEDIKKKIVTNNGTTIRLNAGMIKSLEHQQTLFYKKGKTVFSLQRAEVTQYVEENTLMASTVFSNNGRPALSQKQARELAAKGKLTLKYKGDDIEFQVIRNGQPTMQAARSRSTTQSSQFVNPAGPDEFLIEYSQSLFPLRNMNEFDKILGAILTHRDAEPEHKKYGMQSRDPQLNRFISQMPWNNVWNVELGGLPDIHFPWVDLVPWEPFCLSELRDLYWHVYNAQYRAYIKKFRSFQPTLPGPLPSLPDLSLYSDLSLLPKYEIGVFTTYTQKWELLGYSRGALLSSISLAPREELSIEIFTFDRFKTENERTFSTEFESNLEINSQARTAAKIAHDLTSTTDTKANLGLGIPIPAGNVPVTLNGTAGIDSQVVRSINATVDDLHERTEKSTERMKATTQVKVVQSEESGEEKKVIRKIQNPNVSRTLTFNYFEILENYHVKTKYNSDVRPCLLVKNPDLGPINLDFVLAYEDRLTKALLSRIYQPGFNAAKVLAAQRWFEERQRLDKEAVEKSENEKGHKEDPNKLDKNIIRIAKNLKNVLTDFREVNTDRLRKILLEYVDVDLDLPTKRQVDWASENLGILYFWEKFKVQYPTIDQKAETLIESILDSVDEATAISVVEAFVTGLDDDWVSALKGVAADAVFGAIVASLFGPEFALLGAVTAVVADWVLSKDLGLPSLITAAKQEIKIYQGITSAGAPPPPTGDAAAQLPPAPVPPELFSLSDLAAANAAFQQLVLHIEANKVYYINQIWAAELAEVRLTRFRLKGIDRYIDNQLLGFVGDKAAYPLRMEALPAGLVTYLEKTVLLIPSQVEKRKKEAKKPAIEERSIDVNVPTSGVYMESMLGTCDALEPYMQDRRALDLRTRAAAGLRSEAEAAQQVEEVKRLQARLAQTPPLLSSPFVDGSSTVSTADDGIFDNDNI